MPNDLEGVEYAALPGEGPGFSSSRRRFPPRIPKRQVVTLSTVASVFGLLMLLLSVVPPTSRELLLSPSIPDNGLLADVQGEIMRLESVLAILFDRFIEPGRLEGRD